MAGPAGEGEKRAYLPWRQILRMPAVWLLALARFVGQAGRFLVQVHLVAFFAVAGYDPLLAASAIGVMGLVNLVGRPTMGALSDALGREIVLTLGYGLHILALTVLMLFGDGHSLWPVMIFVGLSGFCDGIGGLVTSAKVADLFPARSLGTVMGIMEGSVKLAYMSGPLVGGVLFDRQGDYQFGVFSGLVIGVVAAGYGQDLDTGKQASNVEAGDYLIRNASLVLMPIRAGRREHPRTARERHGERDRLADPGQAGGRHRHRHAGVELRPRAPAGRADRLQRPAPERQVGVRRRSPAQGGRQWEGSNVAVLYPTRGLNLSLVKQPALAQALARAWNDFIGEVCATHPRLRGVAMVSLLNIPEALKELNRAVTTYGLDALTVHCHDYQVDLGSPAFWPPV